MVVFLWQDDTTGVLRSIDKAPRKNVHIQSAPRWLEKM